MTIDNGPATAQWVCSIDSFDGRTVTGWALPSTDEPGLQGAAPSLDIYVDDALVATEVAPVGHRPDVERVHGRTSLCGFAIIVPLDVEFGQESAVVRVVCHNTGQLVQMREFVAPYSAAESGVELHIDSLDGRTLSGWVKRYGSPTPLVLDVRVAGETVAAGHTASHFRPGLERAGVGDGRYGFVIPIQSAPNIPGDSVEVEVLESGALRRLGTATFSPHPFRDVYRSSIDASTTPAVNGWVVNENRPGETFAVELAADGIGFLTLENDVPRADLLRKGISHGLGGVRIPNPFSAGHPTCPTRNLALIHPDGSQSRAVTAHRNLATRPSALDRQITRGITIIVPVYNAYDDVRVCLERLRDHTPRFAKVVVVDDCSTDSRIADLLDSHADWQQLHVVRNAENLGFTKTVNTAIDMCPDDDVVLLNSDARVTPGWLGGMLLAASSDNRIATVTAMSDRAGAFSAPNIGNDNPLPDGVNEVDFARAFRRRSFGLYPEVPTGNGFCMWISRECLDSIGGLDAEAFPRGYGEENDFCMRAQRAGWHNIIDDRTYVFHDRSKSFGESKTELLASGRAVIDERYPEYSRAVRVFRESWEIQAARGAARLALADCISGAPVRPRVMFVISSKTGGTPQTNRDLMEAIGDAVDCLLMRCDTRVMYLEHFVDGELVEVRQHKLSRPVDPITHRSSEYDSVITAWLVEFDISIVHIRHLAWHSLSLPRLAKTLGVGVVTSFHDFYALSPDVKLIDDNGIFLGEDWRRGGSEFRESLWQSFDPPLEHAGWRDFWRERFWDAIRWSDHYITTSESARRLLMDGFPSIAPGDFSCIEHGRDFRTFAQLAARPRHDEPLRILVPGNINAAKGLAKLHALADSDTEGRFEFHVLGAVKERYSSTGSKIVYHGTYKRSEFSDRVSRIAPHAGAILSIWDETYCHTLTEMWAVGLPVLVLDFPNVSERVRRSGAGWVLDRSTAAEDILQGIAENLYSAGSRARAIAGVDSWQSGWGAAYGTRQMGLRYLDVYRRVMSAETTETPPRGTVLRVGVLSATGTDLGGFSGPLHTWLSSITTDSLSRSLAYIHLDTERLIASLREGVLDALVVQQSALPWTAVAEVEALVSTSGVPLFTLPDSVLLSGSLVPIGQLAAPLDASQALLVPAGLTPTHLLGDNPPIIEMQSALSWLSTAAKRVPDGKVRALYIEEQLGLDDLAPILPALDGIAANHPNFSLLVAATESAPESDDVYRSRPWIEHVTRPSDRTYDEYMTWAVDITRSVDFAIVPGSVESPATGASHLAVLNYHMLGLRTLTSATPPAGLTHPDSVQGVAYTTEAWTTGLQEMIHRWEVGDVRIERLGSNSAIRRTEHTRFDQEILRVLGAFDE